jgi:hypothetical protein
MNLRKLVFSSLILLFILGSTTISYAISPDDALENPGLLPQIGKDRLLYTSYALGHNSYLLSYSEYDEFVDGYGAVFMRRQGNEPITTWSYLAARVQGNTGIGLGIHKGRDSNWLMDLGWSYKNNLLNLSFSLNDLWPAGSSDKIHYRAGASINITSMVSLGVDTEFSGTTSYIGYVTLKFSPKLKSTISFAEKDSNWKPYTFEIWVISRRLLLNAAHKLDNEFTRLGLGVTF